MHGHMNIKINCTTMFKAAVDVCPHPSADWPPTLTFRVDTFSLMYLPKGSSHFKLISSPVQTGRRTGLFLSKCTFCYSEPQMRYFAALSSLENVKRLLQYVLLELIISKSHHCLPYNGHLVSSPGVQRPRSGVHHPPPPSAEVKERVHLCLCFPSAPLRPVLGWI
jgi:hypothetical protein